MKNDRSRIYAKVFAAVNSLTALPALFLIAASVLLFLMVVGKTNESVCPVIFVFFVWLFAAAGFALLFGYWRAALGKLSPPKIKQLWIGTIIYNSLFLTALSFFGWLAYADGERTSWLMIYLVCAIAYCTAAIIASVFALRENLP